MADLERSRVYDSDDEPSGGQKPSDVELSRRRNKGAVVRKLLAESKALRAERDQLAAEKAELERQLGGKANTEIAKPPREPLPTSYVQSDIILETEPIPEYVKPPQTSDWYEQYRNNGTSAHDRRQVDEWQTKTPEPLGPGIWVGVPGILAVLVGLGLIGVACVFMSCDLPYRQTMTWGEYALGAGFLLIIASGIVDLFAAMIRRK